MKKRVLPLLLSFVLLLTMLPATVFAENTMTISDQCVEMVKDFEGYRQFAYGDGGSWYIGYGTSCEENEFPNGVTEAEAEMLLREHMARQEAKVNVFLQQHGIQLAQHQFDALLSLTYNLGTRWINPTYRLCQYLMDGVENYSELEIMNAIGTWCHVGKDVVDGLAMRRLREAYLFLYGDYENNADETYVYVHFEVGPGEIDHSTVFFPINTAYEKLPSATCPGKYFQGWYRENGQMLTADDIGSSNITVTARWGDTAVPETGLESVPWDNPFVDVPENEWFYAYVRNLSRAGVVNGYGDGTFLPKKQVTAGEALKLILLAAGEEEQIVEDVTKEHWANGYLQLALEKNYVTAEMIPDLNEPITRGTVAVLAANAMGLERWEGESPFVDTENSYAAALYHAGVITGSFDVENKLVYLEENSLIRAEMCAIVWRISQFVPAKEPEQEEPPKQPDNNLVYQTPDQLGYIPYKDEKLPILSGVPVAPYRPEHFYMADSFMYYLDPSLGRETSIGVDVSSYQEEVNWHQVKRAGVDFAFVRLGFRGYTEGTINIDKNYEQNVQGALDAGLDVGVYFFSQAINELEAVEEALYVIDALKGKEINYPVVFDWEVIGSSNARTKDIDDQTLTNCAVAFCETIKAAGYTPMVYFNLPVGYTMYDLRQLTQYDFWFAQYPPEDQMYPTMYYDYQIWQYTDSGTVPGIEGDVDMNIAWKRW